jgi:GT2 family glycosyltransferase
MNIAFRAAHGIYIVMISDDCLLLPHSINRGVERVETLAKEGRRVGGVAFYYRDWPHERKYYVQLTLGGNLMVNHGIFVRPVLEEIGWADEDRYSFYKADSDLCLRIWQAGYEIVDCPEAYVEHHAHANTAVRASNNETLNRDRIAYLERWKGIYYHPDQPERRRRVTVDFVDQDRTAEHTWGEPSGMERTIGWLRTVQTLFSERRNRES